MVGSGLGLGLRNHSSHGEQYKNQPALTQHMVVTTLKNGWAKCHNHQCTQISFLDTSAGKSSQQAPQHYSSKHFALPNPQKIAGYNVFVVVGRRTTMVVPPGSTVPCTTALIVADIPVQVGRCRCAPH